MIHYVIKEGDEVTCPICGKKYTAIRRSTVPRSCSKECLRIYRSQALSKPRKKQLACGKAREGDIVTCQVCGKQYVMKYRGKIPCCSKECTAKLKSTRIKNYLMNNPRKKAKKLSYFEKTGYEKPILNPEVRPKIIAKIKATKLERYGDENYNNSAKISQSFRKRSSLDKENSIKKLKKTKLERYGDENYINSEKIKQTLLKKYGTENPSKIPGIKQKIKQNNLKKYGVEFTTQLPSVKEKIRKTNLRKYGVNCIFELPEIRKKADKTKIKNNSLRVSNDETYIKSIFDRDNILYKTQYKSKEYPFFCDFYLPEFKLYIEYQGHWMHGKQNRVNIYGPYDQNNPEHQEILKKWKQKAINSKQYEYAIRVWTIRDPLKRQTAKENNLNWIEFFSIEEFEEWYKNFK